MGKRKNKQTRKLGGLVLDKGLDDDMVMPQKLQFETVEDSPTQVNSMLKMMKEPQERTPPKSNESIEESKEPCKISLSDNFEEEKLGSSPCSVGSVQSFEAAAASQELQTAKQEL